MIDRYGAQDRLSYYLPILFYHRMHLKPSAVKTAVLNRYAQLRNGKSLLKGIVCSDRDDSASLTRYQEVSAQPLPLEPSYEAALSEFLAYCKERQYSNLLFVQFPHVNTDADTDQYIRRSYSAGALIEQYGYPYLDLCRWTPGDPDDLSIYYDFEHLNLAGQVAFTSYLGKYLTEDCGVVPSERNREAWDECSAVYADFLPYAEQWVKENRDKGLWESAELLAALRK